MLLKIGVLCTNVYPNPRYAPEYTQVVPDWAGLHRTVSAIKRKKDPEFQGLYGPYGTLKIYLMAGNTGFEKVK